MADGPLKGIRILDLTHVWAGPLATRTLADLGASVVKIEASWSRGPLDFGRTPPVGGWIGGDPGPEPWNANAVFAKLQRNKRSVSIDLKSEVGRGMFLELTAVADVVIENFSRGTLRSLGLDYEELDAANPRIVYVTISGYGTTGPYRDRVAFGTTVEPVSGLAEVLGYEAGGPRNSALAIPDAVAGVQATSAVVTALRRRRRTGRGCRVELSLHEAGVGLCGPFLIEHQLGGGPGRLGNRHPAMAPHGVYRTAGADDWVALACRDERDWRALCDRVGGGLDPSADLARRQRETAAIDAAIGRWTRARSKQSAARALQDAGVPAGPVNTTPDMAGDEHVQARGFFVRLDAGTPMPGNPIRMPGTSPRDWTPSPRLGADNRAVLREWLGYDDARIDALERAAVLSDRPRT